MTKKRTRADRSLVPKAEEHEVSSGPQWHGTIRWTVDRNAWMSGKQTAFEPKDGLLHLHNADTGATQDIRVGQSPEAEAEAPPEEERPSSDVIDVDYRYGD